jgi:RNA polymerase sigma factor (sigma-70 family)
VSGVRRSAPEAPFGASNALAAGRVEGNMDEAIHCAEDVPVANDLGQEGRTAIPATAVLAVAEIETNLLLLARVKQGDSEAFWELWLTHYRRNLFVCLHHLGGNQQDAEEAMSALGIKAHKAAVEHRTLIADFTAWSRQMAINHCINAWRDEQRRSRHTIPLEQALTEERAGVFAAANDYIPDQNLLRCELENTAQEAIWKLPPRLREPTVAYLMQACSSAQIAHTLHIPGATVRKRLERSRARLRRTLQSYLTAPAH